jgi:hypothetical protein
MTRTAKQLPKKYGILASPNPKPGRSLYPEVYTVKKFHCHDSVNTVMLGRKDYVTTKTGCIKEHRIYDIYSKNSLHSNISEITTK